MSPQEKAPGEPGAFVVLTHAVQGVLHQVIEFLGGQALFGHLGDPLLADRISRLGAEGIDLAAAGINTAIARDPIAPDTALGLILLDDIAAP